MRAAWVRVRGLPCGDEKRRVNFHRRPMVVLGGVYLERQQGNVFEVGELLLVVRVLLQEPDENHFARINWILLGNIPCFLYDLLLFLRNTGHSGGGWRWSCGWVFRIIPASTCSLTSCSLETDLDLPSDAIFKL